VLGGLSALAVALALFLVAGEARARGVELEWQAPDGCPGRERVEAGVERITGRTILDSSGSFALLRATISVEGGRYRMTLVALETSGAERERTVFAEDCEQAAEAAIAVLATTLGASAQEAPVAEAPPVAETPASRAPPPAAVEGRAMPLASAPAESTAASAPRGVPAALEGSLGAALGLELGTLPRPSPFGLIWGGFAFDRLLLRLEGAATLPVTAQIAGTNGGADIFLVRGTLAGCYRAPWKPGLIGACAGGELGSLFAAGFGVEKKDSGSALWSAGVLELLFRADVAAMLAVSAGAGLVVPLRSLEVVVKPLDPLHETPPIAGRFWLGAEFVVR
jgi:hypothetical protein